MPLAKLLARGFAITFVLASGFIKISVLLFYRRLTAPIVRVVWAIYFALGFTTLVSAGLILYMAIVCSIQPVVTCQNNSVATLAAGIFSVVSDVYSIVLPIAVTWSLNLPFWKRVGLGALFSCGLVIVVVSSLRTYYLWRKFRPCPLITRVEQRPALTPRSLLATQTPHKSQTRCPKSSGASWQASWKCRSESL